MAYSYKSPDRDQLFLLPPSVRDWLPEDHLVWFVLDVVSMLDLSSFHAKHPNDGVGRRAYDPEMMLALLIYSYCTGLRSSRRIAATCRTDLAVKAICADIVPAHDAIGQFRADHEAAIVEVFTEVLSICSHAGLVSLGTVAIDGTKVGADAALDQNRTERVLRDEVARMIEEAGTADQMESVQPTLEGSVPEVLANHAGRRARLEEAIAQIEAEKKARQAKQRERDDKRDQDAQRGLSTRGRKPTHPDEARKRAETDLVAAQVRLEGTTSTLARLEAVERVVRAERVLGQARRAPEVGPATKEPEANTTDPESRIMKTAAGWIQGFNAQAAVSDRQIVLATSVTQDANDVNQYRPMVDAVTTMLSAAGITEPIGVVLADAGYWSLDNASMDGPDRLIATMKDWRQRRALERWAPLPVHPRSMRLRSMPWSTVCALKRVQLPTPSAPTPWSRPSGR